MPLLPTLTVTDPQSERLLAVFGSKENYKAWLLAELKKKVMETELAKAREDANAYVAQKREALEAEMAGIT